MEGIIKMYQGDLYNHDQITATRLMKNGLIMEYNLLMPHEIKLALDMGAVVSSSVSGGKDSQAQHLELAELCHTTGNLLEIVHADLGRAEWPQSMPMCQQLAANSGLPLQTITRPQGDLIARMKQRLLKVQGTGKPFWPSSANRYCTGEMKRNQIDKLLRKHQIIISVQGLRAEESKARSKKQPVELRTQICSQALKKLSPLEALKQWRPGQRVALNWYPLLGWTEAEVYARCGHSITDRNNRRELYKAGQKDEALTGWRMHPAYVFGNQRVSCVFCVLGSINDLKVGATHHPRLLRCYREMEIKGNATFKNNWGLIEL